MRVRKILMGVTATLALAATVFLVPTCFGTPWSINHLGMREFIRFAADSPETLTSLHVFDVYGDELDDRSPARREELFERLTSTLETLDNYDRARLSSTDQVTYDALHWLLTEAARLEPYKYHDYPVNQMFGVQSGLPDFMINTHQITDEGDAEDFVARIRKFDTAIDQVIEGLELRADNGIIAPRFVWDRVIQEMEGFIAGPPTQNPMYAHFDAELEKLEEREELDPDDARDLRESLTVALSGEVVPAYERLIGTAKTLREKTDEHHGVWRLPDGDRLYDIILKIFTTSDLSADEIHEIGLGEVTRIQGEISSILRQQGHEGETFFDVMKSLEDDARFYYPDTDEGRNQILVDYAKIIEEIDAGLEPFFNHRPRSKVVVKREATFKEKTAPGAHYQPPPLDGSKPGTFYANLYDIKATPRWGMRTLAYHEAVPGHHYQIALSLENEELPLFRRMLPFGAYVEGWALYAEQLAAEQGFQDDPYDRVGYLVAQLFRAVRLVVDTGIHRKKWTREQAIEYMRQNTGMAQSDVQAEIERYIVMPGQACSYMIGRLEILKLRERARSELGDAFELREFHDVVLLGGPLPLSVLGHVVDEWIATRS